STTQPRAAVPCGANGRDEVDEFGCMLPTSLDRAGLPFPVMRRGRAAAIAVLAAPPPAAAACSSGSHHAAAPAGVSTGSKVVTPAGGGDSGSTGSTGSTGDTGNTGGVGTNTTVAQIHLSITGTGPAGTVTTDVDGQESQNTNFT